MVYVVAIIVTATIGLLTAVVELVGRYQPFPRAALAGMPGLTYLAVNAGAAAAVYALTDAFGWRFGLSGTTSDGTVALVRVLIAGFGAMVLLRSALFSFTQGETTIDAGPAALLSGLRSVLDRSVGQRHAQVLLRADLLTGLSFSRDHEALTLLCSTALVNPDQKIAESLGDFAAKLTAQADVSDDVKLHAYAIKLLEFAGPQAVEAAGKSLRNAFQPATSSTKTPAEPSDENDKEGADTQNTDEAVFAQARHVIQLLDSGLLDRDDLRGRNLRVDLQFLLAHLLMTVHNTSGADAFSEVELEDARLLFGANTVLNSSKGEVVHNLLPLLTPLREVRPAVPTGSSVTHPPTKTLEARPAWLIAAALDELGPHLKGDLAVSVLDASIALADLWDARVARAAAHLELGNTEQAAADLDRALNGYGKDPQGILIAPEAENWTGIIHPIRSLLEPGLSIVTRVQLWNAAIIVWNSPHQGGRTSLSEISRRLWASEMLPSASEEALLSVGAPKLLDKRNSDLLGAVAQAIPPRRSIAPLSVGDFAVPADKRVPDSALLPADVMERLRAIPHVGRSHVLGPSVRQIVGLDSSGGPSGLT